MKTPSSMGSLPKGWQVIHIDDERMDLSFEDESGTVTLSYHQLFPGIMLCDVDLAIPSLGTIPTTHRELASINYCRHGRCESDLQEKGWVIVQENNLCFSTSTAHSFEYPTARYRGFEYWIDFRDIDERTKRMLGLFGIDLDDIAQTLCAESPAFNLVPTGELAENCDRICDLLDNSKNHMADLRLATCRLLRALHDIDPSARREHATYLQRSQRDIAHELHRRIECANGTPLAMAQVAQELGVSESSLRSYFTRVYGTTPGTFARSRMLQHAAQQLACTALPVSDIAAQAGYGNPSKFSAAFRREMGMTPLEYRRRSKLGDSKR